MKSLMWSPLVAAALVCAMTPGAAAADQPPPAGPYSPAQPPQKAGVVQFTYSWPTYQIYFCSPVAVGCCHVGEGYCGGDGSLHCGTWPWVFPFL